MIILDTSFVVAYHNARDAAIVTLARRTDGSVVASFDADFQGAPGVRLV